MQVGTPLEDQYDTFMNMPEPTLSPAMQQREERLMEESERIWDEVMVRSVARRRPNRQVR